MIRPLVDGLGRPIVDTADYYVQDARGYVGDFMCWWALDGHGYTCDFEQAGTFKGERVRSMRDTDVPWLAADLRAARVTVVNVERIRRAHLDNPAAAAQLARNGGLLMAPPKSLDQAIAELVVAARAEARAAALDLPHLVRVPDAIDELRRSIGPHLLAAVDRVLAHPEAHTLSLDNELDRTALRTLVAVALVPDPARS